MIVSEIFRLFHRCVDNSEEGHRTFEKVYRCLVHFDTLASITVYVLGILGALGVLPLSDPVSYLLLGIGAFDITKAILLYLRYRIAPPVCYRPHCKGPANSGHHSHHKSTAPGHSIPPGSAAASGHHHGGAH